MQHTLCILKPDALERNLQITLQQRIDAHGLKRIAERTLHLSEKQAAEFYAEHKERPFFKVLCQNMTKGAVQVIVLKGFDAINQWRNLMGATNPEQAKAGTLRKDFGIDIDRNTVHGSDSESSAQREIGFFFAACDLPL